MLTSKGHVDLHLIPQATSSRNEPYIDQDRKTEALLIFYFPPLQWPLSDFPKVTEEAGGRTTELNPDLLSYSLRLLTTLPLSLVFISGGIEP